MRLDKFLKISRIIKRRTVANEAVENGRVTINGNKVKPSYEVKIGDIIVVRFGDKISSFKIIDIPKTQTKDMDNIVEEVKN